MAVDKELLEILACPNCKTKVELVRNGTALKCGTCKRVYPIKDDIPVMLIDEAERPCPKCSAPRDWNDDVLKCPKCAATLKYERK